MITSELEQAVTERIELGYTKEKIHTELRNAGYDEHTIVAVYDRCKNNTQDGSNASAGEVNPDRNSAWRLIGYQEFILGAIKMVFTEWKLLLVYSLYAVVPLLLLGFGFVLLAITPNILGVLLFGVTLIAAIVGLIATNIAFQRALLSRKTAQPFYDHLRAGLAIVPGFILVALYVQFATSLGFLLVIIPGIALAVYLSLTKLVRISDQATGINALTKSFELVYGNWWGVFFRYIALVVIVLVCVMAALFIPILAFGGITMLQVLNAEFFNGIIIPLLFSFLFLVAMLFISVTITTGRVLLYESLQAKPITFTETGRTTVRRWMIAFVILGIPSFIVLQLISAASSAQPGLEQDMSTLPSVNLDAEQFMQEYEGSFEEF